MPFQANASVISTDLDNMLRGMFRDNSDHAITGTVAEMDLTSFTLTANTMGPTGALLINFSGTFTGAAGIKTVRFYFGGTAVITLAVLAADTYWNGEIWIYNTAANAQRAAYRMSSAPGSGIVSTHVGASVTFAKDTTANQTIKLTTQNASAADTTTEQTFNVMVVQVQ